MPFRTKRIHCLIIHYSPPRSRIRSLFIKSEPNSINSYILLIEKNSINSDLVKEKNGFMQAAAFGLSSIVYVPKIEMDIVTELSAFCDKASMV
jgi:hypothetical protein